MNILNKLNRSLVQWLNAPCLLPPYSRPAAPGVSIYNA